MKKLGRKAVVTDSRTLRLSRYFTNLLPPPPAAVDWTLGGKTWGMMVNGPDPSNPPYASEGLGDCTCAAVGHAVQVWTVNASKEAVVTDAEVLKAYEDWCGYNPNDLSTDQGGVEIFVLKDWKAQGFAGFPLTAFASVLPANQIHVKQAINLFTGLYIGLNVPAYIMPSDGNVPSYWQLEPRADNTIVGGHAVYVTGYDEMGINFISWGSNYKMGWGWWAKFVDEAYALIAPAMFRANGESASGFDLEQLETDLVNIF